MGDAKHDNLKMVTLCEGDADHNVCFEDAEPMDVPFDERMMDEAMMPKEEVKVQRVVADLEGSDDEENLEVFCAIF